METEFQLGKMKNFCGWMVVMVAQHWEYTYAAKLYNLNG